jgi:uncharacterized repeat protein (TIGR01451 family)
MVKNEKMLSRTGWWWLGMRLSLAILLSAMLMLGPMAAMPSPVQAAELHVCASGCLYTKIQDAIDDASSGDTIKVAQGTYNENLEVRKAVILRGGYSTSDWNTQGPASSTIVDGSDGPNSVIRVYSADATIDNFTITGGSGWNYDSYTVGGGIYTWGCAPTISNNIIQGNSANWGGGININSSAAVGQPQILYNTISGNTATSGPPWGWGGGIFVNDASPTIRGNTISNNTAYWGGGLLLWHSRTTIEGNIITDNRARGSEGIGGAFFIEEAVPIIKNNVIAKNTAQLYGDGIFIKVLDPTHPGVQAQIINNTIVANKYSDSGTHEGIVIIAGISPIIRNNIVALNGYGIHGYPPDSPIYPTLSNNDVWGNSVANYSNLSPGTNDISADPLFVNQDGGDYHLQGSSPCIDAGTSSDAPDTDFEGDPRPLDGDGDGSAQYDIGADEYTLWIAKLASPSFADPGDTITYTITYRNDSTSTATGVVITDILSTDLLNPNFTSSGANINRRVGTTYVWDVDDLGSSSGGTVTITAQIDPSVVTPTVIQNTAEFYAVETGPFSDDAPIIVGGLKTYLPAILKSY